EDGSGIKAIGAPPQLGAGDSLNGGNVPFYGKNVIFNLSPRFVQRAGRLASLIIEHALQPDELQAGKAERRAIGKWTIDGEFLKRQIDAVNSKTLLTQCLKVQLAVPDTHPAGHNQRHDGRFLGFGGRGSLPALSSSVERAFLVREVRIIESSIRPFA